MSGPDLALCAKRHPGIPRKPNKRGKCAMCAIMVKRAAYVPKGRKRKPTNTISAIRFNWPAPQISPTERT
jgi:hypothetical protein